MKEKIWQPNKNICNYHLIGNSVDAHVFFMFKLLGMNKEKETCLLNKEHISGTDVKI